VACVAMHQNEANYALPLIPAITILAVKSIVSDEKILQFQSI